MYPDVIKKLIEQFEKFPGIGQKSAERFVFYLLESGKGEVKRLKIALDNLLKSIQSCSICQNFGDSDPCKICTATNRNIETVCVVAQPSTVESLEKSGTYKGRYHVLRGLISPSKDISSNDIKIKELVEKLKNRPG